MPWYGTLRCLPRSRHVGVRAGCGPDVSSLYGDRPMFYLLAGGSRDAPEVRPVARRATPSAAVTVVMPAFIQLVAAHPPVAQGYRARRDRVRCCPDCQAPRIVIIRFAGDLELPYLEWCSKHCGWRIHHGQRTANQPVAARIVAPGATGRPPERRRRDRPCERSEGPALRRDRNEMSEQDDMATREKLQRDRAITIDPAS